MSVHIHGGNLSEAWVSAYDALAQRPKGQAVNMTVSVANPGREILAVRQEIDAEVAELRAAGNSVFNKSIHTVANTIFPISLYREGRPEAFYDAAIAGQSRRDGKITSWGAKGGTYIGRLLDYPTYGGQSFNQLARMLDNLNARLNYQDSYEMAFTCEHPDPDPNDPVRSASASTFVPNYDNNHRGGQCLSHISLNRSPGGALSMVALYRHQTFLTRAYGNFLGLARLQHFLVRECQKELRVGELMIVASHAEIDSEARPGAPDLVARCQEFLDDVPAEIEWQARPFGAKWSDLNLPSPSEVSV